jgi:hypothetical protein
MSWKTIYCIKSGVLKKEQRVIIEEDFVNCRMNQFNQK